MRMTIKRYLVISDLQVSGTSMKDQLTRLEKRVDDLFILISKR